MTQPPLQGLYDPRNEHDACGVGFVAHIGGAKSHKIVQQGLEILVNLDHRGAVGADPLLGASRSYALSKAGIFRTSCDCDLYGEISDQMFLGYAKEIENKFGAIWKNVVIETAGLVITQAGLPITAYFFSSSGGKTELAVNAWGRDRTYTQIVDDPGSLDTALNPRFVMWDRQLSQAVVAKAFLLPDVVQLEILSRNESGTIGQIRATSSSGVQVRLRGETFRSRSKIPSAYCDLVGVQN